jgi:hypothetical protein
MSEIFLRKNPSQDYKLLYMYLYHPDPNVKLATMAEVEKSGRGIGSHQALVDSLADPSLDVRKAAGQLTWMSKPQLSFTLDCLNQEINRTAFESTMTSKQARAALDVLQMVAPPGRLDEFKELVAEKINDEKSSGK